MSSAVHGHAARMRRGLTLIEAVISMALVGGLLVAAARTLGTVRRGDATAADRARGLLLARALMDEILQQPYHDSDLGNLVLDVDGKLPRPDPEPRRESGESGGDREDFDDVDDYEDWSESPPEYKDGTAIPGFTGWTRTCRVEWVSPTSIQQTLTNDHGLARITVGVKRGTATVATLVALRGIGLRQAAGLQVLMVVVNTLGPSPQETARIDLLESWNHTVTLISDSSSQGEFSAALALADVAYVPPTVSAVLLSRKLCAAPCGVVSELPELSDELGLACSRLYTNASQMWISDNSHDVTAGLAAGTMSAFTSTQPVFTVVTDAALASSVLARTPASSSGPSVVVIESGLAAGRRVQLGWGGTTFDFTTLTKDARTLLRQALTWAAAGAAAPAEACGNGECDNCEDCTTCPSDCSKKDTGPSTGRYCCGNCVRESPEGDGSICHGNY